MRAEVRAPHASVGGNRAVLARTPAFLGLAGTVAVPAARYSRANITVRAEVVIGGFGRSAQVDMLPSGPVAC